MRAEFVLLGKRINMTSRARRRWLVALIYVGFAVWMISAFCFLDHLQDVFESMMFLAFWPAGFLVNRYLLGGYGYGGLVKPFYNTQPWPYETPRDPHWLCLVLQLPPSPDKVDYRNDERELRQRDHVHFQAYRAVSVSMVIVTMLLYMRRHERPFLGFLSVPSDLPFALTLAVLFVSQTLPQAILLWTEPDMEEPR